MIKYDLGKMAKKFAEKMKADGDEYWEDAEMEYLSEFKYSDIIIDGMKFVLVQTDEGEYEKGCCDISKLFKREDGKFFELESYTYDEWGNHDTNPEWLTEVEVKEVISVRYSY